MKSFKEREQIIKEFLGLDELSPMEAGVIRGGIFKKPEEKVKDQDDDIDIEDFE